MKNGWRATWFGEIKLLSFRAIARLLLDFEATGGDSEVVFSSSRPACLGLIAAGSMVAGATR